MTLPPDNVVQSRRIQLDAVCMRHHFRRVAVVVKGRDLKLRGALGKSRAARRPVVAAVDIRTAMSRVRSEARIRRRRGACNTGALRARAPSPAPAWRTAACASTARWTETARCCCARRRACWASGPPEADVPLDSARPAAILALCRALSSRDLLAIGRSPGIREEHQPGLRAPLHPSLCPGRIFFGIWAGYSRKPRRNSCRGQTQIAVHKHSSTLCDRAEPWHAIVSRATSGKSRMGPMLEHVACGPWSLSSETHRAA